MNRSHLLECLHEISTGVKLTVLTSEMALECEYVTPEGYGSCWLAYDAWPALEIQGISEAKFIEIQAKIKGNCLTVADIEDTQLYSLYKATILDNAKEEDLNEFFSSFADLEKPQNGSIYAIVLNVDEPAIINYFTDYDAFSEEITEFLGKDVSRWDDCSDDELEYWLQRIESDFQGIPCGIYED